MNDTSPANLVIKNFVRQHLGCECPDQVFDNISIIEGGIHFDTYSTIYEIGGRLLVVVLTPADWRQVISRLEQLVETGRELRDQKGFNRLRLVIATADADAGDILQAAFIDCPDTDNKTHLHVVHPYLLPSYEPVNT